MALNDDKARMAAIAAEMVGEGAAPIKPTSLGEIMLSRVSPPSTRSLAQQVGVAALQAVARRRSRGQTWPELSPAERQRCAAEVITAWPAVDDARARAFVQWAWDRWVRCGGDLGGMPVGIELDVLEDMFGAPNKELGYALMRGEALPSPGAIDALTPRERDLGWIVVQGVKLERLETDREQENGRWLERKRYRSVSRIPFVITHEVVTVEGVYVETKTRVEKT